MNLDVSEIRPPSRALFLSELPRALSEVAALSSFSAILRTAPRGDGHAVLVLPGFTASDDSTRVLRRFLEGRGYQVFGWGLGRNLGPSRELASRMVERLRTLYLQQGGKLSLVGQSLGGVYARELARRAPLQVRRVVTLGSPFAGSPGAASNIQTLYDEVTGESAERPDPQVLSSLGVAPPVPTTAIYSRGDGIVHWKSCIQREGRQAENLEVTGSHCGMGFNPLVLYALADRLAQPETPWAPFERRGVRRVFFPRPVQCSPAEREPEEETSEGEGSEIFELAEDLAESAQTAWSAAAELSDRTVAELGHEAAEIAGEVAPEAKEAVERGVAGADRSLREIGILDFLGFELLTEASSALAEGVSDLRLATLERTTTAAKDYLEGAREVTEARSLRRLIEAHNRQRRRLIEHQVEGAREARRILRRTARQLVDPLRAVLLPFGRLVRSEWRMEQRTGTRV